MSTPSTPPAVVPGPEQPEFPVGSQVWVVMFDSSATGGGGGVAPATVTDALHGGRVVVLDFGNGGYVDGVYRNGGYKVRPKYGQIVHATEEAARREEAIILGAWRDGVSMGDWGSWGSMRAVYEERDELRSRLAAAESARDGEEKARHLLSKGLESVTELYDEQKHRIRELESALAAMTAERDGLAKRLAEEERSHEDTIRHRDFCEEWADKLAYAVGDIEEIGEHSNLNSPWEQAYAIVRRAGEVRAIEAERDKLQAFKSWVHAYLDTHGVPHHPPGTHGAAGCRIGDRMDWLLAERDAWKEDSAAAYKMLSVAHNARDAALTALAAERASAGRLREALRPFAALGRNPQWCDKIGEPDRGIPDVPGDVQPVRLEDCRRAAAILLAAPEPGR